MLKYRNLILSFIVTLSVAVLFSGTVYAAGSNGNGTKPTEWEEEDEGGKDVYTETIIDGSPTSGTSQNGGDNNGGQNNGGQNNGGQSKPDSGNDKKEKRDVNFTGVYNERQIIPNSMAIFCQVNAKDVVEDMDKMQECVNKIVKKINNSDAQIRTEGLEEYSEIKYEELKIMLAQAITKGAIVSNYEKIQNSVGDATAQTKTEHEDNVALANSISTLTDVINSMRDLYAERLKNSAIIGINDIDPKVLNLEEKDGSENPNKDKETGESGEKEIIGETFNTKITYTVEEPYMTEFVYQEGNNCTRQVCTGQGESVSELDCQPETRPCPDGVYFASDNYMMVCIAGSCNKFEEADPNNAFRVVDIEKGMCKNLNGEELKCPDGKYEVDGKPVVCDGGSCSLVLDEVVVTPGHEGEEGEEGGEGGEGDGKEGDGDYKPHRAEK